MEFVFKKVDSEDLLKETFRIRYEIYCLECGFLDPANYPDGLEIDKYDPHSIHFAAIANEEVIGTVRLVKNSDLGFPLEEHCPVLTIDRESIPRDSLVEVSRLALRKSFRRRREDGLYGVESYITVREGGVLPEDPDEQTEQMRKRQRPAVILGLYKVMFHETKRCGFTHWYAAMEKKLWSALKKFHFTFREIGPEVDYYGPVTPYLGVIEELEKEVTEHCPQIWPFILDGLERKYWPKCLPPSI